MKYLMRLHILWAVSCTIGCATRGNIADDFRSEDPKVRIAAIRRAGRDKLQSAAPHLVERLTDSEADVRMFAIAALKEITGLTHGYRHFDNEELRFKAVDRWRQWLVERNAESPNNQPVEERKAG